MSRAKSGFHNKLIVYFSSLPFDMNGKTVCVCLSGGADSVSLLLGLKEIAKDFSFNVCACHFNHQIRAENADNDELFCKSLCNELSIKLYCGRDDVPLYAKTYKLSLEDAARKCRYMFFERILDKNNIDFCATAHNMNDDAETLMLNLLRGSAADGSASIAPYNGSILRPMLKITRDEVEQYLYESSQKYVTDETNVSNEYTRNYIRNVIFPKFREINPSFISSFSKFIESQRLDKAYFDEVIKSKLKCDLRLEHKAIRYRIYVKQCKDAFGYIPNRSMLDQIDVALFSEKRMVFNLNQNIDVIVENGSVAFVKCISDDSKKYDTVVLQEGSNDIFEDKVSINVNMHDDLRKINNLSTHTLLSSANIVGDLCVRNRRVGDRILIHGINKSVKKLMIDKRIPKEYREVLPIICDAEGVIYIPFVGISDRVFCRNNVNCISIETIFNTIDKERWVNAYEK